MKNTKAKAFIVCAIVFAIMLFMGSSVKAAESEYEVSYEKDGKGACYIVLEFKKNVSPAMENQSSKYEVDGKVLRIKENIRNKNASFIHVGSTSVAMEDGTFVQNVSYTPPMEIELGYTDAKVPLFIYENATSNDESILKIGEDGKITPLKAGKTTITAQDSSGDTITWDVEVIDEGNSSQGETSQGGSQEGTETQTPSNGESTDGSNIADNGLEYELVGGTSYHYRNCIMKFSNLEEKKDSSYYLWMSNSEDDMLNEDGKEIENFDGRSEHVVSIYNGKSSVIDKFLEKKGDIYFQIVERCIPEGENRVVYKVIYKKTKLERPNYQLTTKFSFYFFDDYTSTYVWVPTTSYDRKVKIKIGKITDTNILKAIKNSEAGCLEKLLDYAKKTESIYETTIPQERSEAITSKFNLVDEEYYYVYSVLENENGEYYDIEDVGLYQANISDSIGINLWSYLDDNFVWNLPEDTAEQGEKAPDYSGKKNGTEAPNLGPQAGGTLFVAIALVAVGGIGFVVYKKFRNIKIK